MALTCVGRVCQLDHAGGGFVECEKGGSGLVRFQSDRSHSLRINETVRFELHICGGVAQATNLRVAQGVTMSFHHVDTTLLDEDELRRSRDVQDHASHHDNKYSVETTLLESSFSLRTQIDTTCDPGFDDVATLLDDGDVDTECCITGQSQKFKDDVHAHVAETLLDDDVEDLTERAQGAQNVHMSSPESRERDHMAEVSLNHSHRNRDVRTSSREDIDVDIISDTSSNEVEMAAPTTSLTSVQGMMAPSGWLHKRRIGSNAARPRRTKRVMKPSAPASVHGDWNLRHPSTWSWPSEAVNVPTPKSDAIQKPIDPESSRKKLVARLKQDPRFQELRARIAQKNQALAPDVAETPAFESQPSTKRLVATPLRKIEAIEKPPKYCNEVWFRKR